MYNLIDAADVHKHENILGIQWIPVNRVTS
jgi:hypothetical protein